MIPTPTKNKQKTDNFTLFQNPLESLKKPNLFKKGPFTNYLSYHWISHSSYKTPSGKKFKVIKQPTKKGCGAGSALMVILDYLQKNKDLTQIETFFKNQQFFNWFNSCNNGLNIKNLKNMLQKFSHLKPKIVSFSTCFTKEDIENKDIIHTIDKKEDIFSSMKKYLKETNNSIILSIDHQKIGGHYIIVDEIINDTAYIRDPYTQKAYKVNKEELLSQLPISFFGKPTTVNFICLD
jgi:hypothetical protein